MNLQEQITRINEMMGNKKKLPDTPVGLIKSLPEDLKKLFFSQWGAKQNTEWHPEGNTLKHIIVVLRRSYHHYPDDPNMILASLFHDLGKMDTYDIHPKTNQPIAYGHEIESTKYVDKFKDWIEQFDGADSDEIKYIVSNHMKVKPKTWDSMRDSKKEPIKTHPSFDKLMNFTSKLDGGGRDIMKESIRIMEIMGLNESLKSYINSEMDEIKRTIDDLDMDITPHELKKKFVDSTPVELTDDIWKKLENTESNKIKKGEMDKVIYISKKYNKTHPDKLSKSLTSGKYDPPMIVHYKDVYHLVGGNTRLSTASALGIKPKVLIVHI